MQPAELTKFAETETAFFFNNNRFSDSDPKKNEKNGGFPNFHWMDLSSNWIHIPPWCLSKSYPAVQHRWQQVLSTTGNSSACFLGKNSEDFLVDYREPTNKKRRQGGFNQFQLIWPGKGEHKKHLKPPPRICFTAAKRSRGIRANGCSLNKKTICNTDTVKRIQLNSTPPPKKKYICVVQRRSTTKKDQVKEDCFQVS